MMNDIEDISDSDREDEPAAGTTTSLVSTKPETDVTASTSAVSTASNLVKPAAVVDPAKMSLEERLRALDEKYEKWSGSASGTRLASTSSTPTVGSTPATPAAAAPVHNTGGPPSSSAAPPVLPSLNLNTPAASAAAVASVLTAASVNPNDNR